MSLLLGIKLLASPLLIGLASLAGKRWGPAAAGLMGGLPLVGGPVVWALWVSDGATVAAQASRAAPAGVWATLVYLLVIAYISRFAPWYLMIPFGWLCYLGAALLVEASGLANHLLPGIVIIPALWLAATRGLPQPRPLTKPVQLPRVELFARMGAAVALVLALTTASDWIGPEMTGVLACAPVAATVIPAFTLANAGRDALLLTLRGFLTGLTGFAVFFLILGNGIPALGVLALPPALVAAIATGLVTTRLVRHGLPASGPEKS